MLEMMSRSSLIDLKKGIEVFKFIFGHTIKRSAEDEASKRGIRLYATYS